MDTATETRSLPNLIGGHWQESNCTSPIDVTDPATQEGLARAPNTTSEELETAIASAAEAFKSWRRVPVAQRARFMFRYQALLKEHHDELGEMLARETGKTLADAKGDVWRGIEVAELACNAPSMMLADSAENVASGIDTRTIAHPIGVCAGITPFNFPAMIPLWFFPLAIVTGNTFVLKPSEQDPMTPNRLAELFLEAGFPEDVLQKASFYGDLHTYGRQGFQFFTETRTIISRWPESGIPAGGPNLTIELG